MSGLLLLTLSSYVVIWNISPHLAQAEPLQMRSLVFVGLPSIIVDGVSTTFDAAKFKRYGFPAPDYRKWRTPPLRGNALQKWQALKPLAMKAAQATGVDIGIIGMWAWIESTFNPFMENCDKEHNHGRDKGDDGDPNTPCTEWGDYWQVGLGIHPAYVINYLDEAFRSMYGSNSDETVPQVGQSVLDKSKTGGHILITIISSFPSRSLRDIVASAKRGEQHARVLLTTLMKDEAIGVYLIAKHFKHNVQLDAGTAQRMQRWSRKYDSYNPQKIINLIKATYDAD
jgi:hypothetical protein